MRMHAGRRLALSAGLLILSAGTSLADYVFDVDGTRVTAESYWEEGEELHLNRGGVEMTVLKTSVHGMETVPDAPPLPETETHPLVRDPLPEAVTPSRDPVTTEDLDRQEKAVARHLLRVQREKFEAEARGEPARKLARLAKEFDRTRTRRQGILRELDRLGPAPGD
jgi:hypothetical protein